MRIALVGYGAMGREVEAAATSRGHEIVLRLDPQNPGPGVADAVRSDELAGADGIIEFAHASGVRANAALYLAANRPAVVGTTGWDHERADVARMVEEADGCYLWGTNFSVGAHLFFRLVSAAAASIEKVDYYDIAVHEVHHNRKADSPSGTALTTAHRILDALSRKTEVQTDSLARRIEGRELHVTSTRVGSVPGIHRVMIDSPADSIEISHSARSRAGFALGAVQALEWLAGRRGFYSVDSFIASLLDGGSD